MCGLSLTVLVGRDSLDPEREAYLWRYCENIELVGFRDALAKHGLRRQLPHTRHGQSEYTVLTREEQTAVYQIGFRRGEERAQAIIRARREYSPIPPATFPPRHGEVLKKLREQRREEYIREATANVVEVHGRRFEVKPEAREVRQPDQAVEPSEHPEAAEARQPKQVTEPSPPPAPVVAPTKRAVEVGATPIARGRGRARTRPRSPSPPPPLAGPSRLVSSTEPPRTGRGGGATRPEEEPKVGGLQDPEAKAKPPPQRRVFFTRTRTRTRPPTAEEESFAFMQTPHGLQRSARRIVTDSTGVQKAITEVQSVTHCPHHNVVTLRKVVEETVEIVIDGREFDDDVA